MWWKYYSCNRDLSRFCQIGRLADTNRRHLGANIMTDFGFIPLCQDVYVVSESAYGLRGPHTSNELICIIGGQSGDKKPLHFSRQTTQCYNWGLEVWRTLPPLGNLISLGKKSDSRISFHKSSTIEPQRQRRVYGRTVSGFGSAALGLRFCLTTAQNTSERLKRCGMWRRLRFPRWAPRLAADLDDLKVPPGPDSEDFQIEEERWCFELKTLGSHIFVGSASSKWEPLSVGMRFIAFRPYSTHQFSLVLWKTKLSCVSAPRRCSQRRASNERAFYRRWSGGERDPEAFTAANALHMHIYIYTVYQVHLSDHC